MIQFLTSLTGRTEDIRGNYPTTSQTPELTKYESYRMGWFFHPPRDRNYNMSDWEYRAVTDVDWDSFAATAVSHGNVDFACHHLKQAQGFFYHVNNVPFNGTPVYGADNDVRYRSWGSDFIHRFLTAFKSRGIDTALYLSLGVDRNYLDGNTRQDYMDFMQSVHVDIMDRYKGLLDNIFWDNVYPFYNWTDLNRQDWFNENYYAIKERKKGVVITSNLLVGDDIYDESNNLKFFPTDVVGNEWYTIPATAPNLETKDTTWQGTTYYMPKQSSYTGLYSIYKRNININAIISDKFKV